jgi:flagellar biosynthesis protein FliQ
MSQEFIIGLSMNAIWTALKIGGPLLLVTLAVGLAVSIVQAATQVQEATLSFVPKALALIAALLLLGPWMLTTITSYAASVFDTLPSVAR